MMSANPVKILIHDYAGHPFQVQLSRALAARGHHVTHIYASMIQTPRGALERRKDDQKTFQIAGIGTSEPFAKQSFVKRRFQEIEYGRLIAAKAADLAPDWVISGNTPTEAQALLQRRCAREGIRFAAWVQDFYGVAVHKLLRKRLPVVGEVIGGYYRWLDSRVLRASDKVVLITEDFRAMTDNIGVGADRVHVVENWAPLEELPLCDRRNAWSAKHGLDDKFVFLYSGTLGMKHNPELILEVARRYADRADVVVVVISEGIGAEWLAQKKAEFALKNIQLFPFQPFDEMPRVLASADVLVAILEPDAGIFSVPSKVLTYLCAGRVLLTAMPEANLAARIVQRNSAGVVVPPGDAEAFVKGADELIGDDTLRKEAACRARAYAEATFDIETIADSFEQLMI